MTTRRATSVTAGGLAWAWDRLTPSGWRRRRDLAIGALVETQDLAAQVLGRIRQRATDVRADTTRRADAARQRFRDRLDDLADIGAYEARLGEQRATEALDRARDRIVAAIARNPALDRIVDAQLDRTVRPLLVTVLDEVLAALAADPDRLRPIIRAQRESIVDDLVDRIRSGAAAGDATVDRVTSRLLRRAPAGSARPDPATE